MYLVLKYISEKYLVLKCISEKYLVLKYISNMYLSTKNVLNAQLWMASMTCHIFYEKLCDKKAQQPSFAVN